MSRAIRARHQEVLVHTGQHYDDNMSEVFFRELDIPPPEHHLGIGSGSHGTMTGAMLPAIEAVILEEKPELVMVYGDTNSTLAGALAAAKLQIPVAHVEAGLRSFNRSMPEEINRVVADHLSDLLLCPSETAVRNLAAEGITRGVWMVGDVMADTLLHSIGRARQESNVLERMKLPTKGFILATIHRPYNTDHPERLRQVAAGLGSAEAPVVFPVHPRTGQALQNQGLDLGQYPNILACPPLGYLDMVRLEQAARLVVTDSGGVQKEAYWAHTPCLTLRTDTEWVETIEAGWNRLVASDAQAIRQAIGAVSIPAAHPELYGDGHAAARMVQVMEDWLQDQEPIQR
jgi:UDP-N-acetylglucosamine 2-epimerase